MKLLRQPYPAAGGPVKRNDLVNAYQDIGAVVNGNLEFGSPSSPEAANLNGQWATGTTPATPNTEFAVSHNLGRIPTGFLPFGNDQAGSIYRSGTSWTTTQIFLKSDIATMNYTIFIT